MNPYINTVEQESNDAHMQPREQYIPQVRDESRPAASVLGEQQADPGPTVAVGVFVP